MRTQIIEYKSSKIRFSSEGIGKTVVLLHGYLESLEIWEPFSTELAKQNHVVCIDLPGHGQSEVMHEGSTVELMAEAIKAVLDFLKIDKAVVIGHSMGGYAMLAFADFWLERIMGIGLFHSITWADLPEKKIARDREIELIKEGKKQLIVNVNIPRGFADDNLEKLKPEVDRAIQIASGSTDEGIIAVLNALKSRPDRTHILQNIGVPVFFAVGLRDNYIPVEKLMPLTLLPNIKQVSVFENSGHMGFIEELPYAVDEMENFLGLCK
jgi:pimeloyl-ACP methyl ester carboxylesterase